MTWFEAGWAPLRALPAPTPADVDATAGRRAVLGRHLPGLDGIRAVAVLAVLAGHTRVPLAASGWLGVDVFFVLSGYLITGLLLGERETHGRIRLGAFYLRRVLRLYPALVAACVLTVLCTLAGWIPREGLAGHLGFALLYLQDLAATFGWGSGLGPLAHTWSLAIEEHFYLVWPVVLIATARRGRTAIAVTTAALLAATLVMLQLAYAAAPTPPEASVYYRPDVRSGALLVGCLLALAPGLRPPRWLVAVSGAAVAGALLGTEYLSTYVAFTVVMPLVWVATAVVIAAVAGAPRAGGVDDDGDPAPSGLPGLLAWRPLVAIGRISYGLYLYDSVVMNALYGGTDLRRAEQGVLGLAITFALAAASYRLVETPFLRIKRRYAVAPVTSGDPSRSG